MAKKKNKKYDNVIVSKDGVTRYLPNLPRKSKGKVTRKSWDKWLSKLMDKGFLD